MNNRILHNVILLLGSGIVATQVVAAEPRQSVVVTCPNMEALVSEIDSFTRREIKQQTVTITFPNSLVRVAVVQFLGNLKIEVPIVSGRVKNKPKGRAKRLFALQKPKGEFQDKRRISQESLADIQKLFDGLDHKVEEGYHYSQIEVVKKRQAGNVNVSYLHMISVHFGKDRAAILPVLMQLLEVIPKADPPCQVSYGKIYTW